MTAGFAGASSEPGTLVDGKSPPLPPLVPTRFIQYGVAFTAEMVASPGAMCGANVAAPCVLGSGGGFAVRVGWRSASIYLGGAYGLSKQDPDNIYRLATLQQLRAELRYYIPTGRVTQPFLAAGAGAAFYGDEGRFETGGPLGFLAIGAEVQLGRTVVAGIALAYRGIYFTRFRAPSQIERPESFAHLMGIDLSLEALDPL